MPVHRWSDRVVVVHLADDPTFSEDLLAFDASVGGDVVLDFAAVRHINSSNLGQLLKLRRRAQSEHGRIILCGLNTELWGTFLMTSLDCLFEFSDNVPTALATLQMRSTNP